MVIPTNPSQATPPRNRWCHIGYNLVAVVLAAFWSAIFSISVLYPASKSLAVIAPQSQPWMRLPGEAFNLKVSPNGRAAIYTDRAGFNLSHIDLNTQKIFRISKMRTGGSAFFSPDGYRVFYRELMKTSSAPVLSTIKTYDTYSKKVVEIARIASSSGFLTFDPRDMRFQIMHPKGIMSKMIVLPDQRLAKWQLAQDTQNGKWLASPKGMLWLSHSGFSMRKLVDDQSGLQSFDIAPDGTGCTWATHNGGIYISHLGQQPQRIGYGFDPKWHPHQKLIAYAGARKTGTVIVSTDLRVSDMQGDGRWLTFDGTTNERWPAWSQDGSEIIYSMANTTDIYRIRFNP